MAAKDIYNQLLAKFQAVFAIASDGTNFSPSVDTKDFDNGVLFLISCLVFNSGTHTYSLQESEDDGVSDAWADIALEKYLGEGIFSCDSASVPGDLLHKLAAFSTKRYLRVKVDSTGVVGLNQFALEVIMKTEYDSVASYLDANPVP